MAVIDNLSTGKRSNLEQALGAGAELLPSTSATPTRWRRCSPRRSRRRCSISRRRSTCATRWTSRPTTPPTTCSERSTSSRLPAHTRSGGWSTRPPAAACTATPTFSPRPRTIRSGRSPPTGRANCAAEGYCELYTRLHGLSTVSLRYGNVYGPRQDVHGEAGVVAIFCGHLLEGRRPTVFGDGRQTRDWVDVSDVVRANLHGGRQSTSPGRSTSATARRRPCSICSRRSATSAAATPWASRSSRPKRLGEVSTELPRRDASQAGAGLGGEVESARRPARDLERPWRRPIRRMTLGRAALSPPPGRAPRGAHRLPPGAGGAFHLRARRLARRTGDQFSLSSATRPTDLRSSSARARRGNRSSSSAPPPGGPRSRSRSRRPAPVISYDVWPAPSRAIPGLVDAPCATASNSSPPGDPRPPSHARSTCCTSTARTTESRRSRRCGPGRQCSRRGRVVFDDYRHPEFQAWPRRLPSSSSRRAARHAVRSPRRVSVPTA